MNLLSWREPYRKVKTGWITYSILFEDNPLTEVNGYEAADSLVRILNGAYNSGRYSTVFDSVKYPQEK